MEGVEPMETRVLYHNELTPLDLKELQVLFDQEYQSEYGSWDPDSPYGYASQDLHVLLYQEGILVGHAGSQRRLIQVGEKQVLVAGIGGVLLAPSFRSAGRGMRLMQMLLNLNRENLGASYSYLGCREEIVSFYEKCGFKRIRQYEWSVNRISGEKERVYCSQILIAPAKKAVHTFPFGEIDLRGRPW